MSKTVKVKPIEPEIAKVLEAFLIHPPYQSKFKDMAYAVGYKGDDVQEIRNKMFTVNDEGDIGFHILEAGELFFEFQVIGSLLNKDPFKTLLETEPSKKDDIMKLAKRIAANDPVTEKEVNELLTL